MGYPKFKTCHDVTTPLSGTVCSPSAGTSYTVNLGSYALTHVVATIRQTTYDVSRSYDTPYSRWTSYYIERGVRTTSQLRLEVMNGGNAVYSADVTASHDVLITESLGNNNDNTCVVLGCAIKFSIKV